MHQDRAGAIWVGSDVGLTRIDAAGPRTYTVRDGLSLDVVYAIHEDDDGVLWIGTYGGGLNRFKQGRFTRYTTANGLFDDVAYQVLEDREGWLWITCNKGLMRLRKRDLDAFADGTLAVVRPTVYGAPDGLRASEFNGSSQPAGWRARDGRLWLPSIKGVAVVDPSACAWAAAAAGGHRTGPHRPPDAAGRRTRGRRAGPGRAGVPLHRAIVHGAGKIRFRYRLHGFDPEWREAGDRRAAYYTNIPPGRYVFHVVAAEADGVWHAVGASTAITLRPHLYQSTGRNCSSWSRSGFAAAIWGRGRHAASSSGSALDRPGRRAHASAARAGGRTPAGRGRRAESEARYRELYDDAPIGYHELDSTAASCASTAPSCACSATPPREMIGRPAWEFVEHQETSRDPSVEARRRGIPGGALRAALRPQGRHAAAGPHRFDAGLRRRGPAGGAATAIQDIGVRKAAEEALERERSNCSPSSPRRRWRWPCSTATCATSPTAASGPTT